MQTCGKKATTKLWLSKTAKIYPKMPVLKEKIFHTLLWLDVDLLQPKSCYKKEIVFYI